MQCRNMWIIDRFEGEYAVIECGDKRFDVPKYALPEGAREGDVITLGIDPCETKKRSEHIDSLMNKLFGEKR